MEIAYVALAISILGNAALAVLCWRSTPAAIVRDHRIIRTEIERVHDQVEGLQTRWTTKTVEWEALADEIESMMVKVESKRRSIAQKERRGQAAEPAADPNDPAQLRAIARAAGLM
jgi:hypothetical protein